MGKGEGGEGEEMAENIQPGTHSPAFSRACATPSSLASCSHATVPSPDRNEQMSPRSFHGYCKNCRVCACVYVCVLACVRMSVVGVYKKGLVVGAWPHLRGPGDRALARARWERYGGTHRKRNSADLPRRVSACGAKDRGK